MTRLSCQEQRGRGGKRGGDKGGLWRRGRWCARARIPVGADDARRIP